ncbi:hypothetical protein [Actinoplanes derwentensis]|uniref:Uncharacterized protein n=1 Tax=Actinoplanes derwentensis TaxID=113562 RepID=A0A1H1WSQ9_9ACTN|nr:hypothetical protein [Actinoplanes derwentensis]GID86998.1 hypothetical protein Ade03nite_59220 [Actinoplanes derwentensis]SDS99691.1 hypothetical protein SAMN04489716_2209 [Actinoplanes derwentensis]
MPDRPGEVHAMPDRHTAVRAGSDWSAAVRAVSGGRGADRIVDTAGDLEQSLRALAVVALVGSLAGPSIGAPRPVDSRLLFGVAGAVRAIAVGSRAQLAPRLSSCHQPQSY